MYLRTMHKNSGYFLLIYFEYTGAGENLQYPSPVLHFLLLSLHFIHKNEQILLSDEIFLIHQGKGKLFN